MIGDAKIAKTGDAAKAFRGASPQINNWRNVTVSGTFFLNRALAKAQPKRPGGGESFALGPGAWNASETLAWDCADCSDRAGGVRSTCIAGGSKAINSRRYGGIRISPLLGASRVRPCLLALPDVELAFPYRLASGPSHVLRRLV
jgi:hypothetical protein